ncbi:MAG: hypothetical protein ACYTE5_12505, partial [Planctomycetota bacterium]
AARPLSRSDEWSHRFSGSSDNTCKYALFHIITEFRLKVLLNLQVHLPIGSACVDYTPIPFE